MMSERLAMVFVGGMTALIARQVLAMLARRSSTQIHYGGPNVH